MNNMHWQYLHCLIVGRCDRAILLR